MIKITKISSKGSSTLIEWVEDGLIKRSRVPEEEVISQGKDTYCKNPEWGIPWGEPWEDYLSENNSYLIANDLRRAGIWFLEEFLTRRREASAVFRQHGSGELDSMTEAIRAKLGRRN